MCLDKCYLLTSQTLTQTWNSRNDYALEICNAREFAQGPGGHRALQKKSENGQIAMRWRDFVVLPRLAYPDLLNTIFFERIKSDDFPAGPGDNSNHRKPGEGALSPG